MRRIFVIFAAGLAVFFAPSISSADAPGARFLVSGDAMKRVAREAIGFVAYGSDDSIMVLYPTYEACMSGSDRMQIDINQTVPFCRYGYYGDPFHGGGTNDYPLISLKGDAAEIIFNAETGERAWIDLPVEPNKRKWVDLIVFRTVLMGSNRFLRFLPTVSEAKIKVYRRPKYNTKVIDELSMKDPDQWRGLMVLEFQDGFVHIVKLTSSEGIGYCSSKAGGWQMMGTFQDIGWIKLRNDDGELYFWLILVDLC